MGRILGILYALRPSRFRSLFSNTSSYHPVYRRTVLLIWPDSQNVSVVTSMGGQAAAVASLRATKSATPSKRDLDLVDVALASAAISTDAGCLVADLAVRWQDPALWLRAVNSCRAGSNVSVFGATRLVAAYEKFAFPSVGPVYVLVFSLRYSCYGMLTLIRLPGSTMSSPTRLRRLLGWTLSRFFSLILRFHPSRSGVHPMGGSMQNAYRFWDLCDRSKLKTSRPLYLRHLP